MRTPVLSLRRGIIGGTVTGLVLAGGLAAWSATEASAAASYRTVTAARGSVEQTLTATGTVTPLAQADVSFGTSGTVRDVDVKVGDHVDIDDTLAVLDRTALRDAVTSAKATLANAKATLAADRTAQADAVAAASASANSDDSSDSSADSGPPTSGDNGSSGDASKATGKALARLAKQQAALLRAQRGADLALQVSAAALRQQASACDGVLAADPEAPETQDVAGCQEALGAAQAAQEAVAAAQRKVEQAIDTLTGSISAALRTLSSMSQTTGSDPRSDSTPSADSTETPSADSGSNGSPTATTVTAATLARDQSSIDTARAAVVRAEAAFDNARLAAPIAGTIAAVDVAPGDSVSASTVAIVVNGDDGNVTVTIDVTEGDIRAIEVGQEANVTADGASDPLPAKVTSIGLLSASDSGTASYSVVLALAGAPMSLASGSDATVSVVTATARNVVTVPSSAVALATGGATGVVRVLAGDKLTSTPVQVGAVGPLRTEITSGIKAGQRLVLADLSQDLPSSSTGSRIGGGLDGGPIGVRVPAGGGPFVQRSGP